MPAWFVVGYDGAAWGHPQRPSRQQWRRGVPVPSRQPILGACCGQGGGHRNHDSRHGLFSMSWQWRQCTNPDEVGRNESAPVSARCANGLIERAGEPTPTSRVACRDLRCNQSGKTTNMPTSAELLRGDWQIRRQREAARVTQKNNDPVHAAHKRLAAQQHGCSARHAIAAWTMLTNLRSRLRQSPPYPLTIGTGGVGRYPWGKVINPASAPRPRTSLRDD